MQMMGA
jgi:conjugative relaxase-like TrwC/TraI family protein